MIVVCSRKLKAHLTPLIMSWKKKSFGTKRESHGMILQTRQMGLQLHLDQRDFHFQEQSGGMLRFVVITDRLAPSTFHGPPFWLHVSGIITERQGGGASTSTSHPLTSHSLSFTSHTVMWPNAHNSSIQTQLWCYPTGLHENCHLKMIRPGKNAE